MNNRFRGLIENAHKINLVVGDNNTDPRSKGFHKVRNKFMGKTQNYHYDSSSSNLAKDLFLQDNANKYTR